MKVTVRLVDPQSDVDLARTSVELDTNDVTALRARVATEVAEFLRKQLGVQVRLQEERASLASGPAWLLLQRAEKRHKDADSLVAAGKAAEAQTALMQADSILRSAQVLNRSGPAIPAARARVALTSLRALKGNDAGMRVAVDSGVAYANRALAIDPRDADALEYKGQLLFAAHRAHLFADPRRHAELVVAAESSLVHAVSVNKNQAGAWATLSALYQRTDRFQLANSAAYNAYKVDAYLRSAKAVLTSLFLTSYNIEAFNDANQWCNEGRRRFPREPFFVQCRLYLYLSKYGAPNVDSAWTYAQAFTALTPEPQRPVATKVAGMFVAGAITRAGLPDSARRVILRSRALPIEDPRREVEGYEAIVRVMLNEQAEAVRLIEDYLTVNPDHRSGFASRTVWWWRDLQTNPRFQQLLAGAR